VQREEEKRSEGGGIRERFICGGRSGKKPGWAKKGRRKRGKPLFGKLLAQVSTNYKEEKGRVSDGRTADNQLVEVS